MSMITNLHEIVGPLLLTFICTDGTLTDCNIYEKSFNKPADCADATVEIGRRAQLLHVKETVVFICTTKEDAPAMIQQITGGF